MADDIDWLVSDVAVEPLREVMQAVESRPPSPALVRSLRNTFGPSRTSLLLEQAELRTRARIKFQRAEAMFFTRRSLEQATDEVIARWKAKRFPATGPIADLCCGIGGDALAFEGRCDGIDRDDVLVRYAAANARANGRDGFRAIQSDVQSISLADYAAWHIDPDRRVSGPRTTRVEFGEPGIETLERLRQTLPHAAIKLAPAAEIIEAWCDAEREWISSRGECRQQVVWLGDLMKAPGRRTATVIANNGEGHSFSGKEDAPIDVADEPGRYLFDPDPAVVAAGLVDALVERFGTARLSRENAYLTGDASRTSPFASCFEIIETLPFDERKLRAYFKAHGVGRLEIKKRGIEVTPEKLRPRIIGTGDEEAVLLIGKCGDAMKAFIARRLTNIKP